MTNMRRSRRFALAAASLAMALGASGCAYLNPVQTHDFYQASDGVNTSLVAAEGAPVLQLRNFQLIVGEDGRGELIGFVSNTTGERHALQIDIAGSDGSQIISQSVTVEPGASVDIGPGQDETIGQDGTEAVPGTNLIMTVSADGTEPQEITLPVYDTSREYPTVGPSDG